MNPLRIITLTCSPLMLAAAAGCVEQLFANKVFYSLYRVIKVSVLFIACFAPKWPRETTVKQKQYIFRFQLYIIPYYLWLAGDCRSSVGAYDSQESHI